MTALAIILAVGLVGTVGTSIALALQNGRLSGDLTVAQESAQRWERRLSEALSSSDEKLRRRDEVAAQLKERLRDMRERLETHEDPEVRAAAAIDGVLGLLQGWPDESDPGSGDDREAGEVPAGNGAASAEPGAE